jgi:hypothetical protein
MNSLGILLLRLDLLSVDALNASQNVYVLHIDSKEDSHLVHGCIFRRIEDRACPEILGELDSRFQWTWLLLH